MRLQTKQESEIAAAELDYIKKHLLQIHTGINGLAGKESHEKKKEQELKSWLDKQNQHARKGYSHLLEEIFSIAKEDRVFIDPAIGSIPLQEFSIKAEGHQSGPKENENLQQFYGFSHSVMLTFYEISKKWMEEKRYSDAIDAFTFLCLLNPGICSFWVSLGIAHDSNQNWSEAIDAFEIAMAVDHERFDPYHALIHTCQKIKDYSPAKRALEQALENPMIKNQAEEALRWIKLQRK